MVKVPSPNGPARGARRAAVDSAPRGPGWQVALVAGVPVLGLGFAQGGYFATAWGWAALGFLWCTAVALVMRQTIRVGVLDVLSMTGLGGLVMWILFSTSWSASPSESVLEAQRVLVYLAALAALVVVVVRRSVRWLLGGLLGAIVIVCSYGLVTRLFPRTFGISQPLGQYRLAEPIGYWNSLGLLAAMGTVLALAFAAGASRRGRALAGAMPVILLPTLYFTFGRAAWVALAVGLATAVGLGRGRRRAFLAASAVVAPWSALAVIAAARSPSLTTAGAPIDEIAGAGARLALGIALLAVGAASTTVAQPWVERALPDVPRPRVRPWTAATAIAAVLAIAISGGLVVAGGPNDLVGSLGHSFSTPPAPTGGQLDQRLFSLYGEGRAAVWRVAADAAWTHPVAGIGAGAFEQEWLAHRPRPQGFRDVHNLYLETLAELGVVGFALLLTMIVPPVVAALRARERSLAPAAAGGLACYLAHAAFDWDWEMPAVTIAAFVFAAAALALARRDGAATLGWPTRAAGLAVTAVLAAAAIVGLVGNGAVGASIAALGSGDHARAEREAARATRWAPWSAEPWRWLGEARLAQGNTTAARRSFDEALRRQPRDWALWYGAALASRGAERRRALTRAAALNPLSPEVRELTERVEAGRN
jgi:O-antigen ligase